MNTYLLRENGLLASVRRPFFNSRNVLNKKDHLQKPFSNVTWVVEFCYNLTPQKRNFMDYKFSLIEFLPDFIRQKEILKPFIKRFQSVNKHFLVLVLNFHRSTISL